MDVQTALTTRRSVRRFLPTPVPEETVRKILTGASYAPSGHNIQPWRVYVVTGAARDRVSDAILDAIANDPEQDHQPEFDYYPTEWFEPFIGRRRKVGHDLYGHLNIAREDKAARERQMQENYTFFGAPVGMFVTVDRRLAAGSFMDIGMFLQNIFVGARGEGLHTCGQACFNWFHKVIGRELDFAETEMLCCGLSLGYADEAAPENQLRADKLSVDDFTVFLDS